MCGPQSWLAPGRSQCQRHQEEDGGLPRGAHNEPLRRGSSLGLEDNLAKRLIDEKMPRKIEHVRYILALINGREESCLWKASLKKDGMRRGRFYGGLATAPEAQSQIPLRWML